VASPSDLVGRSWSLSLYETAGEAGGAVTGKRRSARVPGEDKADPERSAVEAARRARGQVRRYCTANRLNRLGTLTYGALRTSGWWRGGCDGGE
jgi:hypothetical protein